MTTNTPSTSSIFDQHSAPGISYTESVSQELVQVLQKIVENAGALLDVTNCSVALLDTKASLLVTLATLHKSGYVQRNTRFQMNEGVAGWVAEHRQSLIIDDVSLDARFKKLGRAPVGSMACMPLIHNGLFIGTLTVSSPECATFDARKQRMLAIFAEQAVLAISNARQAEIAQRQANQLEMLLRLSQGITTSREVDELYRAILVHVQRLVPSQRIVIYVYNELSRELRPTLEALAMQSQDGDVQPAKVKLGEAQDEPVSLHHSTSLVAWAATHHHPMIHAPVKFQQDESYIPGDQADLAEMAVPLVSKETLYGVLILQRPTAYTSEELRLIRNLSDMAAAALENIALFQRVRAGQQQWRAIWEASSDGIALLGSDARLIEANPAFGRMIGQEAQQITGMDFLELFGCSEETIHAECQGLNQIQAVLQEQRSLPYIELDLPIQGVARSIGLSVTLVSPGSAPFSLMIARDITAIRDATRVKANFISMITHELRAPINTINGYLDLALTGIAGELNDQQREFIQRARSGSENLYALVEDLLLVSRADAGQLRLNPSALRLDEVIANSVEEMELTARDGGVEIVIDLPDNLPRVSADNVRLQQVLRNLLSNAIRYTPGGGRVTVTARLIEAPREGDGGASNDLHESSQVLRIEVADTGSGIDAAFHERIFERFFQVPLDISGRAGGQGLGLAIVKMIVELHGGSVAVSSAPGMGSSFTFTMPAILPLT